MLGEEVSISDRICLRGKAFTCLRQNLTYRLGTISLTIDVLLVSSMLRQNQSFVLRQIRPKALCVISKGTLLFTNILF